MEHFNLGRLLLIVGIIIAAVGGLLLLWESSPLLRSLWQRFPLGRLPGDIFIQRPGLRIYFPIVTCLVISVVISIILYFFRK
ncbi:DUF2905 domain-containing protein [Oceanidesulfovibrio marinus]|uniref:DUF2905 domain-containing protein n=1 Tax=Oceanidesulfovibrio marinus TaxID=370038 RepID=A0A6P1ZQ18_9BACT|nr:DUF2905 domain-containing protein [Oceanidesulfovibrio marinus]QJT08974.1 DUF2905 domain-containing protein [Oceanidesulfovibrio marinus]TVM36607.1 DUF2905 domain-containing protein [Oceanidesulfovibrio marinus]